MDSDIRKKGIDAMKEYREKVKRGEIESTKPITSPLEKLKTNPKSLRYAINAKCYDCVCYSKTEITKCEITTCPLWLVRPYQKKDSD